MRTLSAIIFVVLLSPIVVLSSCQSGQRKPDSASALSSEVLCPRLELMDERSGFARNVSGGEGSATYWVTQLGDSGPGSLREGAESEEPLRILFATEGQILLRSPIRIRSNKTIDGLGQNIKISGYGIYVFGVENIVITQLYFDSGLDDAISIKNFSKNVWIHRNTFSNFEDGLVDITVGSTDVTLSWNRFENHNKTVLISASPSHGEMDKNIRVTLHHNFFNKTRQRHPRVRFGKVHVYNNYFYQPALYAVGSTFFAEVLVEGNIIEAGDKKDLLVHRVGEDTQSGYLKANANWLVRGAKVRAHKPERVFDPESFYKYQLEGADGALRDRLRFCAGKALK